MAQKLIARLHDGSEHVVQLQSGNAEEALERLTGPQHRAQWLNIENGSVRYESVVAFYIVEEDPDEVINQLLRELRTRGGGTLEEVRRELERRGIGTSAETESPVR